MGVTLLVLVSVAGLTAGAPQFGFLSDFFSLFNFRRPGGDDDSRSPAGPGGCGAPGNKPNHRFGGKDYLVSWRIGCTSFFQAGADNFCRRNGMR